MKQGLQLQRWLHSASNVKQILRERGEIPCQLVDIFRCATTLPLKVFRQWNFIADF